MARRILDAGEKPLHWMGSSHKDLQLFPEEVRQRFGKALGIAQFGFMSPDAKPWKGDGPGVLEIVEDHRGDAFRAVYTVRFRDAVYVLHVFQKKSKQGIKTPAAEQNMIARRLRAAEQDYKEHYGK